MNYSGLTLGEFLENEEFQNYEVLCGRKGLSRIVNSATVMDAVDIENWLRGGEIVMTSGYIWKDNPKAFLKMIESINNAGATALFIKLGRFIDELIPEAYELAEKLNFPIIKMPVNELFLGVIEPVLTRIIDYQAIELRHSQEIHNSFIDIVTKGGGINKIIDTLSILCEKDIAFYDAVLDNIFANVILENKEELKKNYRKIYEYHSVSMDGKFLGSIINLSKEPFTQYDIMAVEHASTVLNLVQQKTISNVQIETKYKTNFVQDLTICNIKTREEVLQRGSVFGWDLTKEGYTCVIIDIDDFKKEYLKINSITDSKKLNISIEHIFEMSQGMITEYYRDAMFTYLSDSLTAIIPNENREEDYCVLKTLLNKIRSRIQKETQFTATISIGCYQSDIMDIWKSYRQAQKCIKISRRIFERNHLISFRELGIYLFLDSLQQTEDSRALSQQKLADLISYDEEHNSQLMETLVEIVNHNWNLKLTSECMFLHYNTIKKRFFKIQELLQTDLNNTSEKLIIELIIRLRDIDSI